VVVLALRTRNGPYLRSTASFNAGEVVTLATIDRPRAVTWCAAQAGAELERALTMITRLAETIEPEDAETLLAEFELTFTPAFKRRDQSGCSSLCVQFVARFGALTEKTVEGKE
jgi:hypothetical protein